MSASSKRSRRSPPRAVRFVLRCLWLLGLCVVALGPLESLTASYGDDLDEALPERGLGHFEAMEAHFAKDFTGYGRVSVLTPQFGVILLSHSAIGFLHVAMSEPALKPRACASLERVTARAFDSRISAFGRDPREVRRYQDYNLYLTHLSLVLGARRLACGEESSERDDAFHARINAHLRRRSLSSGNAHARSYPRSARFPADQAATLASLYLYDLGHDTHLSREPIRAWLAAMERPANQAEHGLHRSALGHAYPHSDQARGCALSWTAMYMPQFAPEEARALYENYREHYYLEVAGLGGFREYAPGISASADADSGPIVFGMGVAATGLAVGAARLHDDSRTYHRVLQTASTVGIPSIVGSRSYALAPMLGEAILFHATTARRWDGPGVDSTPYERSFPWGAIALLALLMLLIGRSLRALSSERRKKDDKATTTADDVPAC